MAHFSESLCEEVIRSEGKCGLTRNEMTQMARFALQAIRQQNPLERDAWRYKFLRETWANRILGMFGHSGPATGQVLDDALDNAMSGTGTVAGQLSR